MHWDINPFEKTGSAAATGTFDIDLAYSYNWKGMIETGPYLGLEGQHLGGFAVDMQLGAFVEYNFIKNKGKKKTVPSAGLKIGTKKMATEWKLALAPYVSLKYFGGKKNSSDSYFGL